MFIQSIETHMKGSKLIIDKIVDAKGEQVVPLFEHYSCPEDYIKDNIIGVEPMTAKEPLNSDELDIMLDSEEYIAEEKLDGTRSTIHILPKNRSFSRRISKKTDWYAENTDSLVHIRDFEMPQHLYGTVLDGEMRIDGKEFKEVSSTLNCKWDEAIYRQTQLGFITFHAFDIIYYCGVYVAKMPLEKRKELLKEVVKEIAFDYIKEEFFTDSTIDITIEDKYIRKLMYDVDVANKYPNFYNQVMPQLPSMIQLEEADCLGADLDFLVTLDKRAWYDYILLKGGEGLMLKSKKGTYKHTRGREYTKWKKFDTWDVIVLDFLDPTIYYDGKERNNPEGLWTYWCDAEDDTMIVTREMTMQEAEEDGLLPITKNYAMNWIGTVKYGVIISDAELDLWHKKNPKDKPEIIQGINRNQELVNCLVVGECSGMDETTRDYMTKNKLKLLGTVIEVGANEILKTGKLRHPRFIRFREDKEMERCTWRDHIR